MKINYVLAGIFGGVGAYFEIDPVVGGLFCLLVVVLIGIVPEVSAYIIAIYIIPNVVMYPTDVDVDSVKS